jgi:hypothetical protein
MFIMLSFGFQQPSNFDVNAKIKAVYLYNFTRYFEWPANLKSGNFVIQIVGKNDALVNELNALASKKKVGSQSIEIKNVPSYDSKILSNMIFLLPESTKALKDVSSKLKGKGTLVVSENIGGAKQGACINFVIVESKQKFEYNKSNAVKSGLKTSEDFQSLAISVD